MGNGDEVYVKGPCCEVDLASTDMVMLVGIG